MGRTTRQNHITSPELIAQINPDNLKLLKDFIRYMQSVQRSPDTIAAYENDLKIFFVWCINEADNKFFIDLKIRDFVNFQSYLMNDNGNSPARIRRVKASISSFSNVIELLYADEYPLFRNLIKKLENPTNVPVREKTILKEEQVESLLEQLLQSGDVEKACCFALAAYSGRRKAELFRFKVSDFDDAHIVFGTFYRSDPIKTKGRGAYGKMLQCYTLAKPFKVYLDAWMEYREKHNIESSWLFPDPSNPVKHRNADIMNSWCDTATRLLGVEVYPHAFRHRATTRLAEAGLPNEVIKELFGWSSVELVSIYNDSDPIDDFSKYFKDGNIVTQKETSLTDL